MLGSAEIEDPMLIRREIVFEEFQTMWSQYSKLQTDRQTDGRIDEDFPWQHRALRNIARQKSAISLRGHVSLKILVSFNKFGSNLSPGSRDSHTRTRAPDDV